MTLTVTDDAGASATDVAAIVVDRELWTLTLRDDFEQSVVNGWGDAVHGGTWATDGATSAYGVAAGRAASTCRLAWEVRLPPRGP